MAIWEADANKLPIFGQRGISSQDWKDTIHRIYDFLHVLRTNNVGAVQPDSYAGSLWYDTSDPASHKLKFCTGPSWTEFVLSGSLGSAAYRSTGVLSGNVVELGVGGVLPGVNGSLLTNINSEYLRSNDVLVSDVVDLTVDNDSGAEWKSSTAKNIHGNLPVWFTSFAAPTPNPSPFASGGKLYFDQKHKEYEDYLKDFYEGTKIISVASYSAAAHSIPISDSNGHINPECIPDYSKSITSEARSFKEQIYSYTREASRYAETAFGASAPAWEENYDVGGVPTPREYNFPDVVAYIDGHTYRCIGSNVTDAPTNDPSSGWQRLTIKASGFFEFDIEGDCMPAIAVVLEVGHTDDGGFELDLSGDVMPIEV